MQPLHRFTRILLALSALTFVATYFLPLWTIQLWAPQYPEGLTMHIWVNRISGDFDIINGLNHYIGMRTIHADMFPEFQFMDKLIGLLILLAALPVCTARRRWLYAYAALLCAVSFAGMIDYYRWGYDYGHNLDPRAAISVPGMSYQPPIFGYKNLLNFVAYAGPASGGWAFIAGVVTTVALAGWEYWRNRARRPAS
ncbi:MAG: hypothetical protein C0502_06330 [Opitutus sp.]|nr:hypothetical protein [Opitutus sp.]